MNKINNEKYNAAYDLINRNILSNPDKIAFIDNNNNKITYNELFIKVKTFAQSIRNIDINPNDRVLVCMDDSINYPIVFLGLIWAGVIPICINTMLPVKDYQYMIKDSEAKAIIISSHLISKFKTIEDENSNLLFIYDSDKGDLNLDSLIQKNNKTMEIHNESFEKDIAFWLYSSGSTGSPKGTLHMHKSLIETASNYAKEILKINKHDICFSAAKLFFAYGLGNALTFPMSVGATSILMSDRPTPESVSHIIQKNAVTLFFGVPTLYAALLNSKISHSLFKSLRLSVSAGEALPANLYEKWYNFLGIKVLDGIGSTEMLHIFISNTIDNITPGASGKPVPGYEARLINDDGSIASDNQIAELEIKGPSSAVSYWNKPEKSKVTFKAEWTRTGDKYIRDTRGIYTYCGRADDMMKVSGQYVSPFEVEAALQTHDEVLEAAVVAKKDKDNLIKPKAFIILKNQCNDEEILKTKLTNHVKKQLTPFKYPRWYEFVEVLPKTATGKIQRYKLRTNDD